MLLRVGLLASFCSCVSRHHVAPLPIPDRSQLLARRRQHGRRHVGHDLEGQSHGRGSVSIYTISSLHVQVGRWPLDVHENRHTQASNKRRVKPVNMGLIDDTNVTLMTMRNMLRFRL